MCNLEGCCISAVTHDIFRVWHGVERAHSQWILVQNVEVSAVLKFKSNACLPLKQNKYINFIKILTTSYISCPVDFRTF